MLHVGMIWVCKKLSLEQIGKPNSGLEGQMQKSKAEGGLAAGLKSELCHPPGKAGTYDFLLTSVLYPGTQ